jgi:hypothetical protein
MRKQLTTNINDRLNQLTKAANLMNPKRIFLALVTTAVIATIAGAQYSANEYTTKAKKADLTGTWLVDVTPQGEGAPPPFKALASFHSDGTLVETESDTLVPPFITPGHGVWSKVGSSEFTFLIVFLTFDSQGNFTGTAKARSQLTMTGPDTYSDRATVEFFDNDGNLLFGGDAIGMGSRVKID